jgi:hypothetical protein
VGGGVDGDPLVPTVLEQVAGERADGVGLGVVVAGDLPPDPVEVEAGSPLGHLWMGQDLGQPLGVARLHRPQRHQLAAQDRDRRSGHSTTSSRGAGSSGIRLPASAL